MNKDKLTSICHKISDKTNLSFNEVMVYYFLESILEKISSSSCGDNFIFKGGFLLSNIVGLDTRSTVKHRETELDYDKIITLLEKLLEDKDFLKRWKAYQKKNSYVQASFEEVVSSSVELLNELK